MERYELHKLPVLVNVLFVVNYFPFLGLNLYWFVLVAKGFARAVFGTSSGGAAANDKADGTDDDRGKANKDE